MKRSLLGTPFALMLCFCVSLANAVERDGVDLLIPAQPFLSEPPEVVLKLAEAGNADAQFDLAWIAATKGDWANAANWFQKSADNGNDNAKFNLSMLIAKGNPRLSFNYAMEAARAGNRLAMYEVAVRLKGGTKGATQNSKEGITWLTAAAKAGHAIAQYDLGASYYTGDGVERNLIEAHCWLSLSLQSGFDAVKRIRIEVEKEMTREQIAEATKLARERFDKFRKKE